MSRQLRSVSTRSAKFATWTTVSLFALVAFQPSTILARAEENAPRHLDVDERTIRQLGVDPRIANLYEVIDFQYTGGMFHDEPFDCGIIKPSRLVPGEKYPLLVWMAGIGPEELDETAAVGHLRWLELIVQGGDWSKQRTPYYILVMKVKAVKGKWFDRYGDPPLESANDLGDEQVTVLHELMKKVITEHAIDREKVYLMGVSHGGTACFEIAIRYPDLFSAIVPMASEGGDVARVSRIVNIPVWAFHSAGDHPERIRSTIAALKDVGGIAHLTEVQGEEHNCWTPATTRYDIFGWLFAQRQGHRSYPPGFSPLPWWNWLALIGIVFLGYIVWRSQGEKRRFKRI